MQFKWTQLNQSPVLKYQPPSLKRVSPIFHKEHWSGSQKIKLKAVKNWLYKLPTMQVTTLAFCLLICKGIWPHKLQGPSSLGTTVTLGLGHLVCLRQFTCCKITSWDVQMRFYATWLDIPNGKDFNLWEKFNDDLWCWQEFEEILMENYQENIFFPVASIVILSQPDLDWLSPKILSTPIFLSAIELRIWHKSP